MPLLNLMISNNPKMDWYNTWYLNYGHNRILTLIILCLGLEIVLLHIRRQMGLGPVVFLLDVYQIWDDVIWLTPEKGTLNV